jgi:RNA polymerase sigma-70 factor (ECF subfamily)
VTEDARQALADYLTRHYAQLKGRLTRFLGNGDLAGDALQDTWVRLQAREDAEPIANPAAYLVRMAVNIAVDLQRRQSRAVSFDEIEAVLEMADPAPGPAQTVQTQSELEHVLKLLDRLPERRRAVLLMVRVDGLPQKEVAARLGVTKSVVEHELRRAHDFLDLHLRDEEKK